MPLLLRLLPQYKILVAMHSQLPQYVLSMSLILVSSLLNASNSEAPGGYSVGFAIGTSFARASKKKPLDSSINKRLAGLSFS